MFGKKLLFGTPPFNCAKLLIRHFIGSWGYLITVLIRGGFGCEIAGWFVAIEFCLNVFNWCEGLDRGVWKSHIFKLGSSGLRRVGLIALIVEVGLGFGLMGGAV